MPYTIRKRPNVECYSVKNAETGRLHARCTSLKKARSQERLLRAVEHGWSPSRKSPSPKKRRLPKASPHVVTSKKRKMPKASPSVKKSPSLKKRSMKVKLSVKKRRMPTSWRSKKY